MSLRELTSEEMSVVSGAGANSATENVGANRTHNRNRGPSGNAGAYSGVSSECLTDMPVGFALGGFRGGLPSALLGMVGNSYKTCLSDKGKNNNSGGAVSPGQCTW